MLSNYVNSKLTPKIKIHLKLMGNEQNIDTSPLVEKVKEVGMYRIIWKDSIPVDMELIPEGSKIEVMNGKYHLFNISGNYVRQLFSSEFIQFDLKEFRDYKLKKILK